MTHKWAWRAAIAVALGAGAMAAPAGADTVTSGATSFSFGQLQAGAVGATGCGTNTDGEPAIHVSRAGNVFLGSERGLGGGSDLWRAIGQSGGAAADACALEYRGQPNAVNGAGASGGDIDLAIGSAPAASGSYPLYVASLNLASVSVAHSTDNGTTFSNVPVQGGLPGDDREWIAAYGATTSLLTFHDVATSEIDVLRSTNGGQTYTQVAQAIPITDYKAMNNELGNLVIDHRNPTPSGSFWAYQAFVAPSKNPGATGSSTFNEAFVSASSNGGGKWTVRPIPCSTSTTSLDHNFPNVSVDPAGNLWYAWSDDHNVFTAKSTDHGQTWTCSGPVSTNTSQAIFPWLAATSAGVDLVYYGSPTATNQTWYVYFAQNLGSGWGAPNQLMPVHTGAVCEGGVSCTGGRQLLDDFGVDTDPAGWAHIAYSHDSPDLGGAGSYTGSAVQTAGTPVGSPNN